MADCTSDERTLLDMIKDMELRDCSSTPKDAMFSFVATERSHLMRSNNSGHTMLDLVFKVKGISAVRN